METHVRDLVTGVDQLRVLQPIAASPNLVELLKVRSDWLISHCHHKPPVKPTIYNGCVALILESTHLRSSEASFAEVLPFLNDQELDWEKVSTSGEALSTHSQLEYRADIPKPLVRRPGA
eukprot:scaffold234674_cov38-Prasinocladus_malaysianus.AAC.1